MQDCFSLPGLVEAVNAWCSRHAVSPANGQASEELTPRNVQYYRTAGLIDAPAAGQPNARGYTERHRLQLIAIRLLQAQGLPLKRIRALLFGRSDDELREIERRGGAEWANSRPEPTAARLGLRERWESAPLGDDFVLLCREGRAPDDATLHRIANLLIQSTSTPGNPSTQPASHAL